MKPQLFSGARGKISFTDSDGRTSVLALITDVSVSENAGLRPTYVIGDIGPVSIEPLSLDVTVSVGRIVPMNKAEAPAGQAKAEPLPQTTAYDLRIEDIYSTILNRDHVEILIEDTRPALSAGGPAQNQIIAKIKYCRFAGRSTNVSSGDVAQERFNFVGILDGGFGGNANTEESINYGFES